MSWPTRILHLGLGRFHRAHQALYYQAMFEQLGEKWGVASFSMRSPDARDEMRRVHNHYPVAIFSKDKAELKWVDAIRSSYFVQEDREAFLDLMQTVDLVTLTVTEKAYASDELYLTLIEGLKQRSKPLTMISCDNLQGNGDKLREGLMARADERLAVWIEKNVSFPNSMVDRIVPALTSERLGELLQQFDTDNPELIATEGFTQWVIENKFKGAKPRLDEVGVQFVEDVKPFEEMKLRLLNASHSMIAYAGLRKGYRFVHEAIRDREIRARVESLYRDVIPQLKAAQDLGAYTAQLITRFDNEQLPHQLKQIAMDGSQKLKQRILPSLKMAPESQALNSVLEDWAHSCFETVPDDPKREAILKLREGATFEVFREKLIRSLFNEW